MLKINKMMMVIFQCQWISELVETRTPNSTAPKELEDGIPIIDLILAFGKHQEILTKIIIIAIRATTINTTVRLKWILKMFRSSQINAIALWPL